MDPTLMYFVGMLTGGCIGATLALRWVRKKLEQHYTIEIHIDELNDHIIPQIVPHIVPTELKLKHKWKRWRYERIRRT